MKRKGLFLLVVLCLLFTACNNSNNNDIMQEKTDNNNTQSTQREEISSQNDEASLAQPQIQRFSEIVEFPHSSSSKELFAYRLLETNNYGVIIWRDTGYENATSVDVFDLQTGEPIYDLRILGSYTNERILDKEKNIIQVLTNEEITIIDLNTKEHKSIPLNEEVKTVIATRFKSSNIANSYHTYDYDDKTGIIYYECNNNIYKTIAGSEDVEPLFDMEEAENEASLESFDYQELVASGREFIFQLEQPNIVDDFLVVRISYPDRSGYVTYDLTSKNFTWYFDIVYPALETFSEQNVGLDAFAYVNKDKYLTLFHPKTGQSIPTQLTNSDYRSESKDFQWVYKCENGMLTKVEVITGESFPVATFHGYADKRSSIKVGGNFVFVSFSDDEKLLERFLVPITDDFLEIAAPNISTSYKAGDTIILSEEEQKIYFDKYIHPIDLTRVDQVRWETAEEIPIESLIKVYGYTIVFNLKGTTLVPAEEVENYLTSYFDVEIGNIRQVSNYNANSNTYTFEKNDGIGGLSMWPIQVEVDGNTKHIYYQLDTKEIAGCLTVVENGDTFKYISNDRYIE